MLTSQPCLIHHLFSFLFLAMQPHVLISKAAYHPEAFAKFMCVADIALIGSFLEQSQNSNPRFAVNFAVSLCCLCTSGLASDL